MTDRSSYRVLYLNGLERTNVGVPEKSIDRYLRSRNIASTHLGIDWHAVNLTYQDLFEQSVESTKQALYQGGRIALVGASAGGSMGINVLHRIRTEDPSSEVSLVCLSSRLKVGDLKNLEDTALHRPGKKPSLTYIESVIECEKRSIPNLSESDKKLIRTVHSLADQVVPLDTMGIAGVNEYVVQASSHVRGIALGVLLIPKILDDIYSSIQ